MRILGLNYSSHDSAAAIVENGKVVAACEEERFNREKHTKRFPEGAIRSCLDISRLKIEQIDRIAFFINPVLHYKLLFNTLFSQPPKSFVYLPRGIALVKKRYGMKKLLEDFIGTSEVPPIDYVPHHLAHSASCFYPSPFDEAGILSLDGRGEYETVVISSGEGTSIKKIKSTKFPHSIGYFYTMMTKFLGFKQHHDEYKVMGLSAYGEDDPILSKAMTDVAFIDGDNRFKLNLDYFDHHYRWGKSRNLFTEGLVKLLGPPKKFDEPLTARHANLAFSVQKLTESIILDLVRETSLLSGKRNLCLAGGVALNCLVNQRILEGGIFDNVFVQPAANDAGTSVGAALFSYFSSNPKTPRYSLNDVYLGPEFSNKQILEEINRNLGRGFYFTYVESPPNVAAKLIHEGNVIGWFQGRMEFGPRALGNRSILASPIDKGMKAKVNVKIKFREGFRPFAPSVLSEYAEQFFDCMPSGTRLYPFMLATANVKAEHHRDIPAVTHEDGTARLQIVYKDVNPIYWSLIDNYRRISNIPVVLNTSFNINKEPIVCTPRDAVHNFIESGLDYLIMGNYLLKKK